MYISGDIGNELVTRLALAVPVCWVDIVASDEGAIVDGVGPVFKEILYVFFNA